MNPKEPTHAGKLILYCLAARKMSRLDLAAVLGVSEVAISNYINKTLPHKGGSIARTLELARALGISRAEIFDSMKEDFRNDLDVLADNPGCEDELKF